MSGTHGDRKRENARCSVIQRVTAGTGIRTKTAEDLIRGWGVSRCSTNSRGRTVHSLVLSSTSPATGMSKASPRCLITLRCLTAFAAALQFISSHRSIGRFTVRSDVLLTYPCGSIFARSLLSILEFERDKSAQECAGVHTSLHDSSGLVCSGHCW